MIEIHAYHGWGFDGSFWDNLKSEISGDILFKAADRGYFGSEFEPEFLEITTTRIIFTHSFGLHWCPQEKLNKANFLVIFNGFGDFLSSEFFERRKELKVLKRMHNQFKNTPEIVLNAFYQNTFMPQKTNIYVPTWMNQSLLSKDLICLRKTRFSKPTTNIEIVSLAGNEDQIARGDRTQELINQNKITEHKIFNGFGHALPIVNSSDCWSYLNKALPIFGEYAK